MFYLLINTLNLMVSTMFMVMKHPLSMGLTLLAQTLLICIVSGMMSKTFWFSYVLFLIFLGGMLVLFIYVTSLASNEMFNFSSKLLMLNVMILLSTMLGLLMTDKTMAMSYFKTLENDSMMSTQYLMNENCLMLNKLYNFPINLITIMMMIYLFLTLIAAVKITNIFEGPLRPNKN